MIQFQRKNKTESLAAPSSESISVPCFKTLNLLAHAQMEEFEIGSLCGGHGVCGGDRIQINADTKGLSPITHKEREHLSAEELAQGWRLGCQCWPEQDDQSLTVWVP